MTAVPAAQERKRAVGDTGPTVAGEDAPRAGNLWIGDPGYLIDKLKDRRGWPPAVGVRSARQGPTVEEPFGRGLGVWVSGFGDGFYNVFVQRDAQGRVVGLRIEFLVPDDGHAQDGEAA